MSAALEDLSAHAEWLALDMAERGLQERVLWTGPLDDVWDVFGRMRDVHPDAERLGIEWRADTADVLGGFAGRTA